MAQTVQMRDTKAADDAFQKVELGWLDHEFTTYGTAYYADDTMYYRVSNFSDKIYSFMDEEPVHDVYPANMMRYTERCPLPAGMKDEKNLDVKKNLARMLQREYPKELFLLLHQITTELRDNSAYELLERERELIEGCFDSVRLDCFRELVKYSYKTLKLSAYAYHVFIKWIDREYKNLEDDFVSKQTSEGQIYAMLYLENGKECYIEDALREYIYEKKFQMEQNGVITTPLYRQIFWYDYQSSFREARVHYSNKLQQIIRENYLPQIQQIRSLKKDVSRCSVNLGTVVQDAARNMRQKAGETLERYLYQWDVRR